MSASQLQKNTRGTKNISTPLGPLDEIRSASVPRADRPSWAVLYSPGCIRHDFYWYSRDWYRSHHQRWSARHRMRPTLSEYEIDGHFCTPSAIYASAGVISSFGRYRCALAAWALPFSRSSPCCWYSLAKMSLRGRMTGKVWEWGTGILGIFHIFDLAALVNCSEKITWCIYRLRRAVMNTLSPSEGPRLARLSWMVSRSGRHSHSRARKPRSHRRSRGEGALRHLPPWIWRLWHAHNDHQHSGSCPSGRRSVLRSCPPQRWRQR